MKKSLILAAALLAIPASAFAQAAPTITVDATDLDLSTTADQLRFENRVQQAARRVCHSGDRGLRASSIEQACRDSLRDAAWNAVNLKPVA